MIGQSYRDHHAVVLLDSTAAAKESHHKDKDTHSDENGGSRQVACWDEIKVTPVVGLYHRTHDDHSKPTYLLITSYYNLKVLYGNT